MKVTLWGTRGSLASPGPDTLRYGGNTTCVSVEGSDGTLLVLDAGTGIRNLGQLLPPELERVHILFTHLHMDHIEGLPFFSPLNNPNVSVTIFGPASTTLSLKKRVIRYLSPPLFPVNVRELLSDLRFFGLASHTIEIGEFTVTAQLVIHYNPTLGYRIQGPNATLTFLPDHNPALGVENFPHSKEWTSGYDLAEGADLLIHDAQYTDQEYQARIGFGHSSMSNAFRFAEFVGVKQFVPFHHDPSHSDDMLDRTFEDVCEVMAPQFQVTPGKEGLVFEM